MNHLRGHPRGRVANDLRAAYETGDSIRGLADKTGHSYSTTRRLLLEAGTTLRPRGNPHRKETTP